MFVPQWPTMATNDNDTTASSNDDEQPVTSTDDNNVASDSNAAMNDSKGGENDNGLLLASITTITSTITTESNDEGIEISSLVIAPTNEADTANTNYEQDSLQPPAVAAAAASAATEYDMALHGGSSNSMEEEEDDDDEDTMYQCQMWTASFSDDNNLNNDSNDDNDDTSGNSNNNNNMSEGISSAFATLSSGGGDIWSTEAFSIPSPLQDLLNSNTPLSLTKLLAQDELLQELRGCEVKLVEYFGREVVVAELVECVFGKVPYENDDDEMGGGRERWCMEERQRRELREEERQKKQNELERLGSREEEDDEDLLHPNHKLLVSSPRENGEEPNVETQWISPAVSPVNHSRKAGEWIFNRDDDDDIDEEEQRTPEEEYDLRFIRYPYMACEVLCSEVGTTLDVLVDGYIDMDDEDTKQGDGAEIISTLPSAVGVLEDVTILNKNDNDTTFRPPQQTQQRSSKKRILDLIFSVLIDNPPSSLDDRRAGYLEKLLVVLFRRRSQTMAEYMNTSLILTSRSAPTSEQLLSSSYKAVAQLDSKEQHQPSSTIEKYPSPNAPQMLMCALLDHLHSHSIMHILQRLLVPSPLRQQGSAKDDAANKNEGSDDVAASTSTDSDDDDNPYSAPNNDFMNAINQMNGNQQMSLHDMDDEDVDDEDDLENDLTHLFQCDWSERPDYVLALLLDRLEGKTDSFLLEYGFPVGYSNDGSSNDRDDEDDEDDAAFLCSQHAAEILVTIIQNSSLNSPAMISLSSDPALTRILDIACLSRSAFLTGESKEDQPEFVPNESKMTCAITVLESLVLQLGGYGAVGVEGNAAEQEDETSQTNLSEIGPHTPPPLASLPMHPSPPEALLTADTSTLVSRLPVLLKELSSLLTHPVTKTWHTPAQYTGDEPRLLLGTSRLRILRLVEALVLLGDASVDFDLQHSDILKHCIDLFWEFEWCSMLHQSVANFLVHVFEGGEGRSGLQEYLVEKCQLVERLIDSFGADDIVDKVASDTNEKAEEDDDSNDGNSSKQSTDIDAVVPVSEEDIDSAMEQESGCFDDNESPQPLDSEPIQDTSSEKEPTQIRKGYMGHVIIICQALAHASTNTGDNFNDIEGGESHVAETHPTSLLPKLHTSPSQQETPIDNSSKPSQINLIIQRDPLRFDKWQQFAASTLAFEMSVQSAPLGGQSVNNAQGETVTSDSQNHLTALINDTSDDFLGEPSGHLIFGGSGAAAGGIDMDEIDLDIADSMMENLSLPSSGESDDSQSRGHNRRRAPSKENTLGHSFGSVIPTTTGFKDYIYDDPLGGGHPFDNEDENDNNLDKESEDDDIMSDAMVVPRDDKETESTSSDESSVEDSNDDDGEDDVPVMDLFAGNVAFEKDENGGWANFSSFEADTSQQDSGPSKNNSGDMFSFSKTPFDFVDTLEDAE